MGKIKDIHKSEMVDIWQDEEFYYFSINSNGLTFSMPEEYALELIKEFKKIED